MIVILAVLVLLILFGGGWSYRSRADGGWYAPGIGTLILVIVLVWLLAGGHL